MFSRVACPLYLQCNNISHDRNNNTTEFSALMRLACRVGLVVTCSGLLRSFYTATANSVSCWLEQMSSSAPHGETGNLWLLTTQHDLWKISTYVIFTMTLADVGKARDELIVLERSRQDQCYVYTREIRGRGTHRALSTQRFFMSERED
ncbi:hypothetical protein RRG08_062060 [Elysia crispata]|uniref:Uncharacterized protein n=1 Tax=Elysia crispata TaxID=231223 RepID=A0AAE0XVL5_9GAST|nr:hypothetical protein RRG08_062060 [Elysia crispata]